MSTTHVPDMVLVTGMGLRQMLAREIAAMALAGVAHNTIVADELPKIQAEYPNYRRRKSYVSPYGPQKGRNKK